MVALECTPDKRSITFLIPAKSILCLVRGNPKSALTQKVRAKNYNFNLGMLINRSAASKSLQLDI